MRWLRRQWRERPVIIVAALLFLATFGGFVRVEQVREHADAQACEDLAENRRVLREILDFALGPPSPDDSPREREFREFTDSVLELPPRCAE